MKNNLQDICLSIQKSVAYPNHRKTLSQVPVLYRSKWTQQKGGSRISQKFVLK